MNSTESHRQETPDLFIRRVVIAVSIVVITYIAWQVREVVIIIFGGLLIATLVSSAAALLMKWVPVSRKVATGLVVLLSIILFLVTAWWVGDSVSAQFDGLGERLPEALDTARQWISSTPLGAVIGPGLSDIEGGALPWGNLVTFTGTALGAIANTILIVVIGVYLAATPDVYWRGLIRMVPVAYRENTRTAFLEASTGLRMWLIGQLIAMVVIGVLTTLGLYLLDVPLALSLGILAGLLEFIPFLGPFIFGFLAILIAFTDGPTTALYVALLILALQQFEGNILTPIVQRRTVHLPPALGLIAVIVFGVLFGIPGILFATPLMVVAMILVQKLYIDEGLENRSAGSIIADDGLSPPGK